LQRAGLEVASFPAGLPRSSIARAARHNRVYQGSKVKLEAFDALLAQTGLREEQTGYMGDDLIDIPSCAGRTGGRSPERRTARFSYAHYVTRAAGGQALAAKCVR